jgi:hypothetical protein
MTGLVLLLGLVASPGTGGAPGVAPTTSVSQPSGAGAPARAWKPLRSAEATGSYLVNDWNLHLENYHPSYVLDQNPATTWVAGGSDSGENDAITLPLSMLSAARAIRLRIWNGYQKSKRVWTENAMPRGVRITVLDEDENQVVSADRELTRTMGPQEVLVDLPPRRGLAAVRLTILSVYPGQRFNDTCVSDILVDVDSDVPYNPAAENAKHEALLKWIAGRKAEAGYFASKPPGLPFAFSRYVSKRSSADREVFKERLAARQAIEKTVGPARFRPLVKPSVEVLPDGLANRTLYADDFAQLFRTDRVTLRETKDQIVSHIKTDDTLGQIWTSSVRVARGPDQKSIKALAFDIRHVTTERTTWSDDRKLLLVYGAEGRLETLYRSRSSFAESEGGEDYDSVTDTDEIWSFAYDAAGKVREIDIDSLARHHNMYGKKAGPEREDAKAKHVVYRGLTQEGG